MELIELKKELKRRTVDQTPTFIHEGEAALAGLLH